MQVVIATRNAGKVHEFEDLLRGTGLVTRSLSDFPEASDPDETGATFEENARIKAEALRADVPEDVIVMAAAVADFIIASSNSSSEVAMIAAHSSVDHIGVHTGPGEVVRVVLVEWQRSLVDAVDSPRRRIRLVALDTDDSVLLDQQHVAIGRKCGKL